MSGSSTGEALQAIADLDLGEIRYSQKPEAYSCRGSKLRAPTTALDQRQNTVPRAAISAVAASNRRPGSADLTLAVVGTWRHAHRGTTDTKRRIENRNQTKAEVGLSDVIGVDEIGPELQHVLEQLDVRHGLAVVPGP